METISFDFQLNSTVTTSVIFSTTAMDTTTKPRSTTTTETASKTSTVSTPGSIFLCLDSQYLSPVYWCLMLCQLYEINVTKELLCAMFKQVLLTLFDISVFVFMIESAALHILVLCLFSIRIFNFHDKYIIH